MKFHSPRVTAAGGLRGAVSKQFIYGANSPTTLREHFSKDLRAYGLIFYLLEVAVLKNGYMLNPRKSPFSESFRTRYRGLAARPRPLCERRYVFVLSHFLPCARTFFTYLFLFLPDCPGKRIAFFECGATPYQLYTVQHELALLLEESRSNYVAELEREKGEEGEGDGSRGEANREDSG
ncbi:hypothetical protein EVAR_32781_1 [Eumeta japonica]|uniref:Uncharacterized protein n=1 Tax=Eumeta variegata TaxID=151549 RepID=A0A4C1WCG4_EUMVA|nr:hypothetical protein EVAR_32781_1 [Eumeta japonica]